MNWFGNFFRNLFGWIPGVKRRSDWRGFKEIDQAKVDTPEEFRERNNT
jgi:hypothetical protein